MAKNHVSHLRIKFGSTMFNFSWDTELYWYLWERLFPSARVYIGKFWTTHKDCLATYIYRSPNFIQVWFVALKLWLLILFANLACKCLRTPVRALREFNPVNGKINKIHKRHLYGPQRFYSRTFLNVLRVRENDVLIMPVSMIIVVLEKLR